LSAILLISDLQNDSYKIGILKSEIYAQYPDALIVDITHSIKLNSTIEAAFVCKQLPENPKGGNIYLNMVGFKKDWVAYVHQKNLYIFPNNGLISMVFETLNQDEVYMFPSGDYLKCIEAFKQNKMNSLNKADVHLSLSYNKSLQINGDMAFAECIFIDKIGNCFFNITESQFKEFVGNGHFRMRLQHYLGISFSRIGKNVSDASAGSEVFTFNRSGYLCLQVNMGNAKQLFRIKDDTKIIIERQ
jgi:S-adenosylmethionine hydrolase